MLTQVNYQPTAAMRFNERKITVMKNMKKTIALVLTFVVIFACFAGCKKAEEGKFEGGALITDAKGNVVAAVATQEDGQLLRDEAGNQAIIVTDAKGNSVKENGEVVTKFEAIDNAIVMGNRIEMADFAINIPAGWSDNFSRDVLNIKKDGTEDQISISVLRNEKLSDVQADNAEMFKLFPSGASKNTSLKVAGEEANFISAFTTVQGTGVYLGFITFSHQGAIFRCMITSDRDISGNINEIIDILNTIEFVH